MFKRFILFVSSKSTAVQLLIYFVIFYFYWLAAWLLFEFTPLASNYTFKQHLIHALFMGSFWTIYMKWKLVKELFKKR